MKGQREEWALRLCDGSMAASKLLVRRLCTNWCLCTDVLLDDSSASASVNKSYCNLAEQHQPGCFDAVRTADAIGGATLSLASSRMLYPLPYMRGRLR